MKLPANAPMTVLKIAVGFAVFAAGYYFPLFRPASSIPPAAPAASSAAHTAASVPFR